MNHGERIGLPMNSERDALQLATRRRFLAQTSLGLGVAALATLWPQVSVHGDGTNAAPGPIPALPGLPHFAPRAKHVIFLHQSGAPSQIETFDHKPMLASREGEQLPESIRMGQRLTSMTADHAKPLAPSLFTFARHGQCGAEVSELLPFTARVVDQLAIVRSLHTQAINHDPALNFLQTGSEQPGRPSIGAWVSYGLGTENANLPAFVVCVSGGEPGDQPLSGRHWGAGFLPARHQAVKFRGSGDPVLYLSDPPGIDRRMRRRMLDAQNELNRARRDALGDPEIDSRIDQAELAFRLQASVPELTDFSDEPEHAFESYGPDSRIPGTYAANCLLARRMIERGVRFVQLHHRGWDHHEHLPEKIRRKCQQTDQPSAALVQDLQQRGLLQETLVIWAGEFGRTAYCQGKPTADDYGRDHHPRCFTIWLAGGGTRGGLTHGATDEFSYNIVANPVHVHDLQATILHCLGIDHERLTFRWQGRDFRLTDIAGEVIHELLT